MLKIAVVGAGPSAFYAAAGLLKSKDAALCVDMYDRLPTPYGLVRYGVAPDHQKIKSVTRIYQRTAEDPRFRFFGHVNFGADLNLADLRARYHAILFAVGAQADRSLDIPGEDARNSMSATEFVAWYNGHPYYVNRAPDLSGETAVVVGVGNVAMDVARILAKSEEELSSTDIADHALAVLKASCINQIVVLSRRGPVQAKFTNAEIREFGELPNADAVVDPRDLELDPDSAAALESNRVAQKNMEALRAFAETKPGAKARTVHFRFLVSPVEIMVEDGAVSGVRLERNRLERSDDGYLNAVGTGVYEDVPCSLILRSVGYRGVPLPDVPFDERRGTIPNQAGRVVEQQGGKVRVGEYVVGWAKRGPTGVIGTNKPDALETVANLLEDFQAGILPEPPIEEPSIEALLAEREVRYVTFSDWEKLDAVELAQGEAQDRPRVKKVSIDEMLETIEALEKP